jgi:NAD(P)-dependent dehydrogenase (short-subunit alcohol dehydrogenase family)
MGRYSRSKSNRRPEPSNESIEGGGKIDVYNILVNNAGFSVWGPTETFEIESFDAMFAANVRAPFLLVAKFAPGMVARGSGSIINIGSMAGRLGLAGGAAYGATKAAVASLTQAWAAEYSPRGVRVNTVAAGPVYTRPEAAQFSQTSSLRSIKCRRRSGANRVSEIGVAKGVMILPLIEAAMKSQHGVLAILIMNRPRWIQVFD